MTMEPLPPFSQQFFFRKERQFAGTPGKTEPVRMEHLGLKSVGLSESVIQLPVSVFVVSQDGVPFRNYDQRRPEHWL